jgi:cytochrome P450
MTVAHQEVATPGDPSEERFAFDPWDVSWRDEATEATIGELVEKRPIYQFEETKFVVSRHEDVRTVLSDQSRFSAKPNQAEAIGFPPTIPPDADPELIARLTSVVGSLPFDVAEFSGADVIVGVDNEAHAKIRTIVARGFVVKRIMALTPRVEAIVAECLQDIEGRSEVEVMEELAIPVPIRVIADLLGVDRAASMDLKRWSDVLSTCVHGETRGSVEAAIELVLMLTEFAALFMPLIHERASNPGEDLISDIVRATEADTLTTAEAVLFLLILMAAANETTTSMIGNAVYYLLTNPDQLALLQAQPNLVDNTIEETLRLSAPVQFVFREALQAEELHGTAVPAGSTLVCFIAAANRDGRSFSEPHRFDITREGLRQANLAFGHGAHLCIGAALGRLEGRATLTALLPHLPHLSLDTSRLNLDRSAFTRAYEEVHLHRTS